MEEDLCFLTCRRICTVQGRVESLVGRNDPVEKSFGQKEAAQSGDEPTVSQFTRNNVQHRSSLAYKHRIGGQFLMKIKIKIKISQRENQITVAVVPGVVTESTVH
jgi:hypothetical protein